MQPSDIERIVVSDEIATVYLKDGKELVLERQFFLFGEGNFYGPPLGLSVIVENNELRLALPQEGAEPSIIHFVSEKMGVFLLKE